MKKLAALIMGMALLVGCGNGGGSGGSASSANPFNWGSGETRAERRERRQARREAKRNGTPVQAPQDTRAFVGQVTDVRGDLTKGGVILRATGLTSQQGFWNAELVPVNGGQVDENGTMAFEFRVARPEGPVVISTERSREIQVGLFLSNQTLAPVRTIAVIGSQNTKTVRRR